MADNDLEIIEKQPTWFTGVDWGAVLAAVITGLGVTFLLVALGIAIGIESDDSLGMSDEVATAVGTWTVVATVIGMLVGGFIGGRFSRWLTAGSSLYHGLTAWSLMVVLSIWLGVTGAVGLIGNGLVSVLSRNFEERTNLANLISWNGWALVIGLTLSLLATIAGWWIGARMRLAEFEQPDLVTSSKQSFDLGGPEDERGDRARS